MVIPIILLGEARDRHLLDALRSLLGERCAWQTREGIFWKEGAAVMLLDLPASSWVDAGGGLVVLKESFLPQHLPEHLLHARCILPDQGGEALLRCGLPCIRCGDTGELRMSRRTRSFVYKPRWLDWTAAALHRGSICFHCRPI